MSPRVGQRSTSPSGVRTLELSRGYGYSGLNSEKARDKFQVGRVFRRLPTSSVLDVRYFLAWGCSLRLERLLRERLDAFRLAGRAKLLRVLMLPDFERAGKIAGIGEIS
jgi:hypothetical protein